MAELRLGDTGADKQAEAAPKPKPKAAEKAPKQDEKKPLTQAQLERQLKELFEFTAGMISLGDPAQGEWLAQKGPELAKGYANWAQKSPAVRRFFEMLLTGSTAGTALGTTAIWAFGAYVIYLARRLPKLPDGFQMASGLLNIPVPEAPTAPERGGEAPGNGSAGVTLS